MLTAEQLTARKSGIGGSDIGAIMGLNPYRSAYAVWLDKTGNDVEVIDNEAIHFGNVLEDVVAREYAERTGRKVQRVNQMMRHPEFEFALANIDRAIVNPSIAGNVRFKDGKLTTDRILECKTANGFRTSMWGEAGTDQVPESYLAQVQWYMFVTGCQHADLAVLIGGQDYRIYTIERDAELIDAMQSTAHDFWYNNVLAGVAPDPGTVAECTKKWQRSTAGKSVIVDVNVAQACDRLCAIAQEQKALKAEEDELKTIVMNAIGDAEEATYEGAKLATWKTQSRTSIDSKALKSEQPDVYALYQKTSESRVFRLAR